MDTHTRANSKNACDKQDKQSEEFELTYEQFLEVMDGEKGAESVKDIILGFLRFKRSLGERTYML